MKKPTNQPWHKQHKIEAEDGRSGPPIIDLNPLGAESVSERHRAFVAMVVAGVDAATAAARAAGRNPLIDRPYWITMSAELMQSRVIDQLIKLGLQDKQHKVLHDTERLRAFVMTGLANIASDETVQPSARLRAYELLGKTDKAALFSERREVTIHDNRRANEIKAELIDRLKSLFGAEAETFIQSAQPLSGEPQIIEYNPEPLPGGSSKD